MDNVDLCSIFDCSWSDCSCRRLAVVEERTSFIKASEVVNQSVLRDETVVTKSPMTQTSYE